MKTILIILILCLATATYSQQRVTGTNEISLDEAIKQALDNNFTARIATNDLTAAQYQRSKAGDNLLPTLSGRSDYGYNKGLTSEPTFLGVSGGQTIYGPSVLPDAKHSLSYNVGAALNIYNGGGDAANIRSADYNLDAAKYNLKWTRQSVAYNVVAAYVNALRFKELLKTNEKTLAESQAQLERIKGLYSAGSIPVGQVYQQEAVVGQQEVQSIAARNNFENSKADLLYLLNVAPDSYNSYDVTLRGIDTSMASLKGRRTDVSSNESTISSLLERREDFAALRSSILASDASIGATRSFLLPRLAATFGIGGSGSNTQIGKIALSHSLSGGLSLSVPIFDAFQNRLQIEIQEVQLQTSKVRLEQSEQQFRSDVAKAQNNLRSAEQALDATERSLRSAEESIRSATERLRVGAGIQVDVIVAESQVQSARTERVNAVYNYLLATKQLEYLLGKTNY